MPIATKTPKKPANSATISHELINGELSPPLVNIRVEMTATARRYNTIESATVCFFGSQKQNINEKIDDIAATPAVISSMSRPIGRLKSPGMNRAQAYNERIVRLTNSTASQSRRNQNLLIARGLIELPP